MSTPRRLLPSLSSLRALEALDRLGSATAVAEELSLTQSAVSRQLQAFEHQMGLDLILRDGRRLTLTPAAQKYAGDVRQALEQIAQASLRLRIAPDGGTLNLAILPTFGMRWLVPRLPEFARLYPQITVNMNTRLQRFSFASEGFDAALHYGQADWPGTGHLLLRHEHLLPVCAPSLVRDRSALTPKDLLRMPLLHIETRPDAWADWFRAQDVALTGSLTGPLYDQFSTITQAAQHGLGVALMPDYLVEQDLARGHLVALHGAPTEAHGAYYLVWPLEKAQDPALLRFRDWLATQAEPEDPLPR
ncbi:LysR family transcriptional regulator [Sedimentitalea todarodis]|uniref:LysR family transcriptional regulator n=1 Tax=Sedimentitalea todarodis TaxID=1631240 RepID=A0ABU3VB68_9RHOB|nr:LysR family transcriptional regulator [Sedimentitalea todarodis]MDU9003265.1 LysR family transcriptional regulator [Sedimentitalea todarodis]